MSFEIAMRPRESVAADLFTVNNKHYLCRSPQQFPGDETGGKGSVQIT